MGRARAGYNGKCRGKENVENPMANYSHNRITLRGPLETLLGLQAESFEIELGPYGDEHQSCWLKKDGEDVLFYHGSTRRAPPCEDVAKISARAPGCLVELSFIDEGFCYDGFMVFKDGELVAQGSCSKEVEDDDCYKGGSNEEALDMIEACANAQASKMAAERSAMGWLPAEPARESYERFINALADDGTDASALGALAGVDAPRRAKLAALFDAPHCMVSDGACPDLGPSLCPKTTPLGSAPGLRAFSRLFDWGALNADLATLELLIPKVCSAIVSSESSEGSLHKAAMEARLAALFKSDRVADLLFSGCCSALNIENQRLSLGERLLFCGADLWAWNKDDCLAATAVFERMARESGRSDWIDQTLARVARSSRGSDQELADLERARSLGERCSQFGLDKVIAVALPSITLPTIWSLRSSTMVRQKGRALLDQAELERSLASAKPRHRGSPHL